MKGYRYRIRLHSHDPQRALPSEIEMIRREEETAREIILRLMSFVMAYEPELEPNGRPSNEVMPYSAALGRWSMEGGSFALDGMSAHRVETTQKNHHQGTSSQHPAGNRLKSRR